MYATKLICVSLVVSVIIMLDGVVASQPPPCSRLECPTYKLIDSGDNYEIRNYTDIVLVTTSPVQGQGFVQATQAGVRQ